MDVTDGERAGVAVDPSVLESLTQRLGDRGAAFRTSLVQTWRDESTGRLTELDEAAGTGDLEAAARVAHTLKSSSAALGAMLLARLCDELESGLRAGEQRDLVADATAVRTAVEQADAAFSRLWGDEGQVS